MAADPIQAQAAPQSAGQRSALRRGALLLTRDEQHALLLVLGLFILGIGARAWFAYQEAHAPSASTTEHMKEKKETPHVP